MKEIFIKNSDKIGYVILKFEFLNNFIISQIFYYIFISLYNILKTFNIKHYILYVSC